MHANFKQRAFYITTQAKKSRRIDPHVLLFVDLYSRFPTIEIQSRVETQIPAHSTISCLLHGTLAKYASYVGICVQKCCKY